MAKRFFPVVCAAWACLGMVCVGPDGPSPALPRAVLTEIHLALDDAETGRPGAVVSWTWPSGEVVTYFEIYQSLKKDSLGAPLVQDGALPTTANLRLPDSARPLTLYYGVRAVFVEPTGQKRYSDSIPVDSLTVTPSLEILDPTPLSRHSLRVLEVAVKTSSDAGIVLRQSLHEKTGGRWNRLLDTCLPMDACGAYILGSSTQRDALILQTLPAGDTLETLYCVAGNETFEDVSTGRMQSLGCTRFFRTGP